MAKMHRGTLVSATLAGLLVLGGCASSGSGDMSGTSGGGTSANNGSGGSGNSGGTGGSTSTASTTPTGNVANKGGGVLKAVMPGVVVEVLVSEGDVVAEGQPLLILEAMKMQNEIPAGGDGVIKAIHASAGAAVAAGDKLMTLTAKDDDA